METRDNVLLLGPDDEPEDTNLRHNGAAYTVSGEVTVKWPFDAARHSISFMLGSLRLQERLKLGELKVTLHGDAAVFAQRTIASGDIILLEGEAGVQQSSQAHEARLVTYDAEVFIHVTHRSGTVEMHTFSSQVPIGPLDPEFSSSMPDPPALPSSIPETPQSQALYQLSEDEDEENGNTEELQQLSSVYDVSSLLPFGIFHRPDAPDGASDVFKELTTPLSYYSPLSTLRSGIVADLIGVSVSVGNIIHRWGSYLVAFSLVDGSAQRPLQCYASRPSSLALPQLVRGSPVVLHAFAIERRAGRLVAYSTDESSWGVWHDENLVVDGPPLEWTEYECKRLRALGAWFEAGMPRQD